MSISVIIPIGLYRYFEHLHFCHRHNFSKRLHFDHLYHHFSKWLHRVHLATPRRISQNTCVSLTPALGPRKPSQKKFGIEIFKTWGFSHPCSHSITAETISPYHTLTTWQSIRIFNLNINSFFHKHRPERSFELWCMRGKQLGFEGREQRLAIKRMGVALNMSMTITMMIIVTMTMTMKHIFWWR